MHQQFPFLSNNNRVALSSQDSLQKSLPCTYSLIHQKLIPSKPASLSVRWRCHAQASMAAVRMPRLGLGFSPSSRAFVCELPTLVNIPTLQPHYLIHRCVVKSCQTKVTVGSTLPYLIKAVAYRSSPVLNTSFIHPQCHY